MKALLLDIETSPIIAHVWQLFDNNVALNQIQSDWHLLSFSAKWLGDSPDEIIYADQRHEKDISNDKKLLQKVWKLLDKADIVIGQNSKKFDIKKLNARFILNGMQPPSSFRQIDTLQIAKKHFGFTSNKLAYMSSKLCTVYKKLEHKDFAGHEMWVECLKGNKKAWKAMEKYNKWDVLSLEELYNKLIPWDQKINLNVYSDSLGSTCTCGTSNFIKNGSSYTNAGKFLRIKCKDCGAETRIKENLLSKEKRKSLRSSP